MIRRNLKVTFQGRTLKKIHQMKHFQGSKYRVQEYTALKQRGFKGQTRLKIVNITVCKGNSFRKNRKMKYLS